MRDRHSAPAPAVLVVDDEPNIRDLLGSVLRMSGFEVRLADSGLAALAAAEANPPDLVVLDVMLPDLDGYTVARRLRNAGNQVPVLFLTARDAVKDRIEGLTAGGDDYVTKPFSLEEVVLRVQAIVRRTAGPPEPGDLLRYADLEMDIASHSVHRGGTPIWLSATEFNLLHYLMTNAEKVVSKRQILDTVWDSAEGRGDRVVETFISQVRRKVEGDGPALIHTVRGVGYSLRRGGERR
ncbi:response regulator transcription factor [Nocardia sp. NBC_00511]|uniref:response regulator transcription factor n=1 Tax=Nocardia sp. NBC_00511 TaxID=2903591 RepID=UPI0030DE91C7